MDYQSSQPGDQEQNQIPIQSIASTPSMFPNNFTPKFIGLIVGLLFVGGVVYGGLWFWNYKNKDAVVPIFTPRVFDEIANWKTYRNEQYGFEFKYPPSWTTLSDSQYTELAPKSETGHNAYLVINRRPATLEQMEESYRMTYPDITRQSITFAGKQAYLWEVSADNYFRMYIVAGKNLEISSNFNQYSEIKTILSTFNLSNK